MDIVGTNFNERLEGTELNDVIRGLSGNDQLIGGSGADQLIGGYGSDSLDGGAGNDTLWGGYDADLLIGGSGADQLVGGYSSDTLEGGGGNDTLWGRSDNDALIGSYGDDVMYGGYGSDALYGDYGNDFLRGFGGGYSQEIDALTGGNGKDSFFVGDSAGIAYMGGSNPNTNSDSSYALITDFSAADDKVQVYGGKGNIYRIAYQSLLGNLDLDTGIYYNNDLLAVVQDTTAFSNENFIFV